MPIAEELMRFGAGLNTTDQDIAMAIKMAAAVIEQIESGEDREFRIAFTFDEFIRLPWHWELLGADWPFVANDGRRRTCENTPKRMAFRHCRRATMDSLADRDPITELICHFRAALKGGDYMALSTVGFRVDETSMLAPDGWIWERAKAREANRHDYLVGVPDIAILLYSAPARLEDNRCKISMYLKYGIRNLWLVHSANESVYLFTDEVADPVVLTGSHTLYLPKPMPSAGIPISEIFRDCNDLDGCPT